jgi:predicted RNA-binding Zn-ribbon protein involved in translation (DUF1610 family)
VTSDTIAAWVAGTLHLDLLLLKSINGIFISGIFQERVTSQVDTDSIDRGFIPFVMENRVKTIIINGSDPDRVAKYLKGDLVPGTRSVQPFNGSKRDTIGILGGAIMSEKKCTSCNAPLAEEGATEFGCPACGVEINRCYRCREQSIAYTCPKCGFGGP